MPEHRSNAAAQFQALLHGVCSGLLGITERLAVVQSFRMAAWASVLLALQVHAHQPADAYRDKARHLYNFALFTEWPADSCADQPFLLCVLGSTSLSDAMLALQGKAVGQRRVEVLPRSSREPLKGCAMVFIDSTAIDRLPQVLNELRGAAVLTVSDSPGAGRQGVMLNMAVSPGRFNFEANLDAARFARLRLDARLLRMATTVRP